MSASKVRELDITTVQGPGTIQRNLPYMVWQSLIFNTCPKLLTLGTFKQYISKTQTNTRFLNLHYLSTMDEQLAAIMDVCPPLFFFLTSKVHFHLLAEQLTFSNAKPGAKDVS